MNLTKPFLKNPKHSGFTIVELLVVIVVIGILASITIVSYTGISKRATAAAMQSDLSNASKQLKVYQASHGSYPTTLVGNCPTVPVADNTLCLKPSLNNTFAYSSDGATFDLTETNTNGTYYNITDSTGPIATTSSPYIQTITAASCSSTRTKVQDARDGHTYWIQKLADNKCWMLTNLGYAGSGTNTYGDTKTLTNGTGGSTTYTVASYYVTPSTTNFTTEPTAPSTLNNGNGQYGYLYNWCAATGAQLSSSGCSSTITTPLPVTTASICPSGWRLPTSNGGEFTALNVAINGGLTNTNAGLISAPWLAQRGGVWNGDFNNQGDPGYYWSSTQFSATVAYDLSFGDTGVYPSNFGSKDNGFAVRCVAN